jgi:hypothetical protein
MGTAKRSLADEGENLIDDIGTPLGVQQRLMRHGDIKTTRIPMAQHLRRPSAEPIAG